MKPFYPADDVKAEPPVGLNPCARASSAGPSSGASYNEYVGLSEHALLVIIIKLLGRLVRAAEKRSEMHKTGPR